MEDITASGAYTGSDQFHQHCAVLVEMAQRTNLSHPLLGDDDKGQVMKRDEQKMARMTRLPDKPMPESTTRTINMGHDSVVDKLYSVSLVNFFEFD